ncbi:unnamed protein product [Cyprideis torosa]|uniref:Uncharacterized protein n=1 Tax=Cyprideis torosa TaxID=163714 RepID=A0A7R8W3W9_9CRUS|nr:unnamed protein product [Cyprideis torosa]CAG0880032.1 unnamed protein product [Cyprideis torosa]
MGSGIALFLVCVCSTVLVNFGVCKFVRTAPNVWTNIREVFLENVTVRAAIRRGEPMREGRMAIETPLKVWQEKSLTLNCLLQEVNDLMPWWTEDILRCKWFRDGVKQIRKQDSAIKAVEATPWGKRCKLEFSKLQQNHSGNYTCVLITNSTDFTEYNATVELNVLNLEDILEDEDNNIPGTIFLQAGVSIVPELSTEAVVLVWSSIFGLIILLYLYEDRSSCCGDGAGMPPHHVQPSPVTLCNIVTRECGASPPGLKPESGACLYDSMKDGGPRVYGKALERYNLDPFRREIQNNIVSLHNYYRRSVKPTASNMLEMTWSKDAAKAAQTWAEACQFLTHDSPVGRWMHRYGTCGQNIFVATHKVPWAFAVKMWFMEKEEFKHGSPKNNIFLVGHYTQMVWATSHKVGCGMHFCPATSNPSSNSSIKADINLKKRPPYFTYVCNYCPIGNYIHKLGEPYRAGTACSDCSNNCSRGLCRNACYWADRWANCKELNQTWNSWLCTKPERERECMATCQCQTKIHEGLFI